MAELSQRLSAALTSRYRIERELGRGGMATVFLAEDLRHERQVALKVLDPEVAAAIGPERFVREITTVAKLTHPHILTLHDSGEADGLLYYAMPYATGETLRQRLEREAQLPLEEALEITRQVAAALDHAHRHGVVHRDIKPENILFEGGHALVADFGVARAVSAAGGERLTATGVAVGTPQYMSPEQAGGSGRLDGRSDQYALGCVLYEMLAGQPPFTGPTVESLVHQHLSVAPHAVTEVRASVPVAVARAITRALAKTPADRFATTGAFAAALTAEVEAAPRAARRALPIAGVAVLVVALASVAAWQQWWPFEPALAPPEKKDWILVAEFEGPPGDSTLAPAAHSLLSAALDQSQIVATVQPDQIQEALQTAGKPPGTRLTPAVAKELAYRSAVRTVLEGTIGKLGTGYSVVVRLVDADTARVLFTESATAQGDDALIPAMGELAKKLRRDLGENRRALAATRPLTQVRTPSFEAYKLYVQAEQRFSVETAVRERIRAYRAALDLDPDFASADLAMVHPYIYLSRPDSAQLALNNALRHPERLSPVERGLAEQAMASLEGDCEGALAARDRVLAIDPGNITAILAGVHDLGALGRYEEGLEQIHALMKLSPFGPTEPMRHYEAEFLSFMAGRLDEAREAARRMTGIWKANFQAGIELTAGRFAVAESIARANLNDPRVLADSPAGEWWDLAAARFGRGALEDADEALKRVLEAIRRAHQPTGHILITATEYSILSDGAIPTPAVPAEGDTSIRSILGQGLVAAARRDRAVAGRCLEVLRRRPERDLAFSLVDVSLLEARVHTMDGRPEEAVRLLRPFDRLRYFRQRVSPPWVHWWLADAYEQMGRPDSAAWYLERVLREQQVWCQQPYVHRRLALLDARLGRVEDAERNLAVAERLWDQPDPAVRRMLDEARAAVRAARAMVPPTR